MQVNQAQSPESNPISPQEKTPKDKSIKKRRLTKAEIICNRYIANKMNGTKTYKETHNCSDYTASKIGSTRVLKVIGNDRRLKVMLGIIEPKEVVERFKDIYKRSLKKEDLSNANRANESMARIEGMFTDKQEITTKQPDLTQDNKTLQKDIDRLLAIRRGEETSDNG